MRSRWIDQHKLKNTPELTEILAQHSNIQAVICGHVHQDSIYIWNNIQFLSTPSTSVQFKPFSDQFALDEQAPGYRILKLHSNGQLDTKVYRLKIFITELRQKFQAINFSFLKFWANLRPLNLVLSR